MPYLTAQDLETHVYAEVITEITRANNVLVEKAINSAVAEAKSYLRKYDTDTLFSEDVVDENLKDKVKDMACWKLVKLSNPNIDMALFKTLNDDAVDWFKLVMNGKADPEGWPYKQDDPATPYVENSSVGWNSNKKRSQHF